MVFPAHTTATLLLIDGTEKGLPIEEWPIVLWTIQMNRTSTDFPGTGSLPHGGDGRENHKLLELVPLTLPRLLVRISISRGSCPIFVGVHLPRVPFVTKRELTNVSCKGFVKELREQGPRDKGSCRNPASCSSAIILSPSRVSRLCDGAEEHSEITW